MPHPKDVPLDKWPPAWLKFECASILEQPSFLMMHDHEKREKSLPVTNEEMRDVIRNYRLECGLSQ